MFDQATPVSIQYHFIKLLLADLAKEGYDLDCGIQGLDCETMNEMEKRELRTQPDDVLIQKMYKSSFHLILSH